MFAIGEFDIPGPNSAWWLIRINGSYWKTEQKMLISNEGITKLI